MQNTWGTVNSKQWRLISVVLIVLAGVVAYANSLHVPTVMDDAHLAGLGPKNISGLLRSGSQRIVADSSFALNYHLHGLEVTGYHLVNLLIHLVTATLLYFIGVAGISALKQSFTLTESNEQGMDFVERFLPVATALLFVTHPIQTQAVTYIIQRYTSLATLFYLLAVLCYLKGRLAFEKSGKYGYAFLLGFASLVAWLLAMGSKQISATLPLMLVFLELFLFKGRLINRRFFVACAGLFALSAVALLLATSGHSWHEVVVLLNQATAEDKTTTRTIYFLTQTRVVVTYLRLLLLPYGQSLIHESPTYTNLFCLPVIASLSLHIFLVATAVVWFKKSRNYLVSQELTQGILYRFAALGIVWFYIAMTIESSIIPISDVIFEHRIYLPSVGFFMTITALACVMTHTTRTGVKSAWTILAAATLALGGATIARNHIWSDSLTLLQDTVNKSPNSSLARANLGGEYYLRKMPDKVIPNLVRAIELDPAPDIMSQVFLGGALLKVGIDRNRLTTGMEYVRPGGVLGSGIVNEADRPKLKSVTLNNLGLSYEYLGDPRKAKKLYRMSLQVNPTYDLAWYNLGLVSFSLGEKEQARSALLQLKSRNPSLARLLASAMEH